MYVSTTTFRLQGLGHDEYLAICREVGPAFSEVPGLRAKTWIHDEATGIYGSIYSWDDRASFEAFLASPLYRQLERGHHFTGLETRGFSPFARSAGRVEVAVG